MPGKPAARLGDMHTCPMVDPGPKPHVGGPVLPACMATVLIGGMPAARVSDKLTCMGPPDTIVKGSANVLIGGKPAARMGDSTAHGGLIVAGCPTVLIGEDGGGGGAPAAAAILKPTDRDRDLAAQENAQPDDGLNAERFAAREKVVRDFYEGRPGLGQDRASQDMGADPVTGKVNANPKGYGIDLNRPVEVVELPPPDQIQQYVKRHGFPGNFFDPKGNQSGDSLGLNADPSVRASKKFNVPPEKQKGLISRNGPIVDDWTDPAHPVKTRGGGTQLTVDDQLKKSLAPQPQPW